MPLDFEEDEPSEDEPSEDEPSEDEPSDDEYDPEMDGDGGNEELLDQLLDIEPQTSKEDEHILLED